MIGIIVQARSRSTRFPGKMMANLNGKPVIEHVLERCAASKLAEAVILAMPKDELFVETTAQRSKFDKIMAICKRLNVTAYAPDADHDNVLKRFYMAAKEFHLNAIVRVTGDCPLIDPGIIDRAIHQYVNSRNAIDYMTNTYLRTHPRGMDVEIFSFAALEAAYLGVVEEDGILRDFDQEHVTPYLRRFPRKFPHGDLPAHPILEACDLRLTVDEPADLELVRAVHQACRDMKHYHNGAELTGNEQATGQYPMFGLFEIIKQYQGDSKEFKGHPEWKQINGHIRQAG